MGLQQKQANAGPTRVAYTAGAARGEMHGKFFYSTDGPGG